MEKQTSEIKKEETPITEALVEREEIFMTEAVPMKLWQTIKSVGFKIRQKLLRKPTPPAHIDVKGGYPYAKSNYVDDEFNKAYPVHRVILACDPIIVKDYWVIYNVYLRAYITPNIYIQRPGAGGSRMQLPKEMNKRLKEGMDVKINPTDFIDIDNAFKSALTKAIKNAEERYGIGGDVTERLIYSEENIKEMYSRLREIVDEVIINPRDKAEVEQKVRETKGNGSKLLRLIHDICEAFDILPELSFLQKEEE